MASISANGSKNHHKFTLNVSENSTSTADNTSNVGFSLVLSPIQSGWDWNISGVSYTITINGTKYTGTIGSYNGSSTVTIRSGSLTVGHNSDGSKSISFSFSITDSAGKSYTPGSCSASGSMTLTKIPRQANLTSAPNFNDEENPTIGYSNPAGNSVSELSACISLTGSRDDVPYRNISKTGTSYTFELTEEERDTLRTACTSNSLVVKFFVRTKIGSSTYYSILDRTMSIINGNPTFSDFAYKDTNTSVVNVTGSDQVLVKGLSNLQVSIPSTNKMVAKKQATEKNYVCIIDTLNVSADYSDEDITISMGAVSSIGINRLNVRAYDSRNNSELVYKDIMVYDYALPIINASITRTNNFERESTLKISGTFSPLNINNVNKNTIEGVQYRYRQTGGTWSSWITVTPTINDNAFSCSDVVLSLDNTETFDFEIKTTDKLETNTLALTLDIGQAIFLISSNKKACYINGQEIIMYDVVDEW